MPPPAARKVALQELSGSKRLEAHPHSVSSREHRGASKSEPQMAGGQSDMNTLDRRLQSPHCRDQNRRRARLATQRWNAKRKPASDAIGHFTCQVQIRMYVRLGLK